jgi:hypothetical protein
MPGEAKAGGGDGLGAALLAAGKFGFSVGHGGRCAVPLGALIRV